MRESSYIVFTHQKSVDRVLELEKVSLNTSLGLSKYSAA